MSDQRETTAKSITYMAGSYKYVSSHFENISPCLREKQSYLVDWGRTLDIESLSISLTTSSFLRKNNVPLDTLTGTRIRSARTVTGKKIFNLAKNKPKTGWW